MRVILLFILLLILPFINGCFDNEQELAFCDEVYEVAEEMPKPIGGIAAIYDTLHYPEELKENGIEGRVVVWFTVNKLGNTINHEIQNSVHPKLDEEAIKAVKESSWDPGRQQGEPVCVRFAVSVNYRSSN